MLSPGTQMPACWPGLTKREEEEEEGGWGWGVWEEVVAVAGVGRRRE